MTDIKLAKLPDRTPVKIAIAVMPDLAAALADYAVFYEKAYGETVGVADLIPAMLESFLASDKVFGRSRPGRPEVRK